MSDKSCLEPSQRVYPVPSDRSDPPPDSAEAERIAELRQAVELWGETVAPRLLRVLCPIYKESVHRPEPVGTGILIRVDELIFLVTAAHVIEDVGRGPRYFGAAEQTMNLPPFFMTTALPHGGTRDDDPLDLGYWIVDPETAAKLSSADTLRLTDLDMRDPAEVAQGADYFLNGYPATRQPRKIRNSEVEARTLAFMTEEVNDAEYSEAKRDRRTHLLVDYAKDNFFLEGVKKEGPDLQGVSGGAVWRLSGTSDVTYGKPLLAAFAIRWRQEEPKCVIGTRALEWAKHAAREFPIHFKREMSRLRPSSPIRQGQISI